MSSCTQIARTLGDRDRRKIARGFHRLCLHAASVSAAERVVAATSLAVATIGADVTKGEATAADGRVGASNPAVAGAAPTTEDTLKAGAGGDDTAMATRVRAEKAEEALRRQGGRLVRTVWGELECSDVMPVRYVDTPNGHDKRKRHFSLSRFAERVLRGQRGGPGK